jgi:hypothetical protein
MSNTITIELHEDDRKRLDEVIGFLGIITGELKSKPVTETAPTAPQTTQEAPKAEPVTEDTPAENTTTVAEPEPVAQPEKVEPKYTKADIQQKVVSLSNAGKKPQVREVIMAYGSKVSDIPEDKYGEVMDKLTALEG